MKNFEILFEKHENESSELDEKLSQCKNPAEKEKILKQVGATSYEFEDSVLSLIDRFTFRVTKISVVQKIIRDLKFKYSKNRFNAKIKLKWLRSQNGGRKVPVFKLEIKLKDREFSVLKITDLFPLVKECIRGVDLQSKSREGMCHYLSIKLSDYIAKVTTSKVEIVTGYIYGLSSKSKYSHSWVELDGTYVCDPTLNAFMRKELFEELYHYEEISRFDGKTVVNDFKRAAGHKDMLGGLTDKEFLFFGKEILEEFDQIDNSDNKLMSK